MQLVFLYMFLFMFIQNKLLIVKWLDIIDIKKLNWSQSVFSFHLFTFFPCSQQQKNCVVVFVLFFKEKFI